MRNTGDKGPSILPPQMAKKIVPVKTFQKITFEYATS